MRRRVHWLVRSRIYQSPQGGCGTAGLLLLGNEAVYYVIWPAPVGTHSGGEPLPFHAGTVALLWRFELLVSKKLFDILLQDFFLGIAALPGVGSQVSCVSSFV